MNIRSVTNKAVWNKFVTKNDSHSFLHSWEWGEFNQTQKNKVWRLGIYNNSKLIGCALVIKIHAKRGTFLFVPHGPIVKSNATRKDVEKTYRLLARHLKSLGIDEGAHFIRISPTLDRNLINNRLLSSLSFRKAPIHVHSEI